MQPVPVVVNSCFPQHTTAIGATPAGAADPGAGGGMTVFPTTCLPAGGRPCSRAGCPRRAAD